MPQDLRYRVRRDKLPKGEYSWTLVDYNHQRVVVPTRDPIVTKSPIAPAWLRKLQAKLNTGDATWF